MTRAKPAKTIAVTVPRHGAQRIGLKFSLAVENLVRKENASKSESVKYKRRVRYQHNHDPPAGSLTQAIESASEWNSLLITARAERGPQWDVGTQQFQVDHGSDLYYDPTPLLEALKQQRPREDYHNQPPARPGSMQPPDPRYESPRMTRNPSASAGQQNYAYGSPRHPQHQTAPFNAIPPGHFYGDPRTGGGMGSMSPDVRRRSGRVGPEEGFISLHGP
ncbi:hypothetical protein PAXRUDRAFT_656073 [Paxillus rubicundulus Ve08.2h10]|uniref:Uncharacterized protein n=1 Tax=Paxillus rubicundulus Ve08.2h10 TaxID=930991 RepID=A0A0D0DXE0_9AGAM|nr:hypothetical protein PAXRUDRAFT_656073 [Paxillus rubicundulus Ve08.2h10]